MPPLEWLWPYPQRLEITGPEFPLPHALRLEGKPPAFREPGDLRACAGFALGPDPRAYPLELRRDNPKIPAEGYTLTLRPAGAVLEASGEAGLAYGFDTFLQLAARLRPRGRWPELNIRDAPAFARRAAMLDLGRALFPPALIRRAIRIFARLRFNELHLRLYDDELCGLRFPGLPFGTRNPGALSMAEFEEIVRFAAARGLEVVPELESWGHAGAIVYHRPDLRGGPGMYAGASFLICEETIRLLRDLCAPIVEVLPRRATLHLGFDEAKWFPGPGLPPHFTPADLLARYDAMVAGLAAASGRDLRLRIYADHAGRPLPAGAESRITLQPWQYWNAQREDIDRKIAAYAAAADRSWMMAVGQSMAQYRGAYHASRYFCRRAAGIPNLEGLTICLWGWNDLSRFLISYFAGAYFAWNPDSPAPWTDLEDYEAFDRLVFPVLHAWQSIFREAFPDAIDRDRGPLTYNGYYLWGDRHLEPVAPTVPAAGTWHGHDFLNETPPTPESAGRTGGD